MRVDIRLPGKGNSNSYRTRLVRQNISTIKWIRTSKLSIKTSHSVGDALLPGDGAKGTESLGCVPPKGPSWGYPRGRFWDLGTVSEPFYGEQSPKVDKPVKN